MSRLCSVSCAFLTTSRSLRLPVKIPTTGLPFLLSSFDVGFPIFGFLQRTEFCIDHPSFATRTIVRMNKGLRLAQGSAVAGVLVLLAIGWLVWGARSTPAHSVRGAETSAKNALA